MPTPVKYSSEALTLSYKRLEHEAGDVLLDKIEPQLREYYNDIFNSENSREWVVVKAADTLAAYIKCIEEIKAGNNEFIGARASVLQKLSRIDLNSLRYFIETYLPAYELTLDEQ